MSSIGHNGCGRGLGYEPARQKPRNRSAGPGFESPCAPWPLGRSPITADDPNRFVAFPGHWVSDLRRMTSRAYQTRLGDERSLPPLGHVEWRCNAFDCRATTRQGIRGAGWKSCGGYSTRLIRSRAETRYPAKKSSRLPRATIGPTDFEGNFVFGPRSRNGGDRWSPPLVGVFSTACDREHDRQNGQQLYRETAHGHGEVPEVPRDGRADALFPAR